MPYNVNFKTEKSFEAKILSMYTIASYSCCNVQYQYLGTVLCRTGWEVFLIRKDNISSFKKALLLLSLPQFNRGLIPSSPHFLEIQNIHVICHFNYSLILRWMSSKWNIKTVEDSSGKTDNITSTWFNWQLKLGQKVKTKILEIGFINYAACVILAGMEEYEYIIQCKRWRCLTHCLSLSINLHQMATFKLHASWVKYSIPVATMLTDLQFSPFQHCETTQTEIVLHYINTNNRYLHNVPSTVEKKSTDQILGWEGLGTINMYTHRSTVLKKFLHQHLCPCSCSSWCDHWSPEEASCWLQQKKQNASFTVKRAVQLSSKFSQPWSHSLHISRTVPAAVTTICSNFFSTSYNLLNNWSKQFTQKNQISTYTSNS